MTRWGIIGAGGIARVFANGVRFSRSGRVVALASRTQDRRDALAEDFGIPRRYGRYEELLADAEVDAVYISVIHPHHARWTIAAAEAGKHILVEKPMAMSFDEAARMVQAARRHDVFLMEAFMYRCHPQVGRLAAMIADGAIGEVRMIRSTFSFSTSFDPGSRLFNPELGGGSILDLGCYPASMSRFIAGAATGMPFAEPLRIRACGFLAPNGVDTFTAATVEFPGGIMAQLLCGFSCPMPVETIVYGTRGHLSVLNPWLPSSPVRFASKPLPADTKWPSEKILLWSSDPARPTEIVVDADRDLYAYQADMVDAHVADRAGAGDELG